MSTSIDECRSPITEAHTCNNGEPCAKCDAEREERLNNRTVYKSMTVQYVKGLHDDFDLLFWKRNQNILPCLHGLGLDDKEKARITERIQGVCRLAWCEGINLGINEAREA